MTVNLGAILQGEIFMSCSGVTPKDSVMVIKVHVSKRTQMSAAVGPMRNWKEN